MTQLRKLDQYRIADLEDRVEHIERLLVRLGGGATLKNRSSRPTAEHRSAARQRGDTEQPDEKRRQKLQAAARARVFRRSLSRPGRLKAIAHAQDLGALPRDFTEADALARMRGPSGTSDWVFDHEPLASPDSVVPDSDDPTRFRLCLAIRVSRLAGHLSRKHELEFRDVARAIADSAGTEDETTYPNGKTARRADGGFYYPSGKVAVSWDGDVHHPGGEVAVRDGDVFYPGSVLGDDPGVRSLRLRTPGTRISISSDGRLRYPSGELLRASDGQWHRRNGGKTTVRALLDETLRRRPADRDNLEAGLDALHERHGDGALWQLAVMELVIRPPK